ncbi:MAG: DMT family transporter [Gammaproteobacteria bacterium]|nr:DMT family transporter [Gammaproteobacteria bacterium]
MRALPTFAVMLGAVATASNPVFVRLSDLAPIASAFHRMAWALPLVWLWAASERAGAERPAATIDAGDWRRLALCGVFFAGDLACLHGSIELTVAANSILFLNAQPIYVVLGAWLLFGERVTRAFLLGLAVALGGVLMLVWQNLGTGRLAGDALGILAGICYAGYILAASRLRVRHSSAVVNAWTCLVATPILLAGAVLAGASVLPASAEGWLLMIGLGVICQALGQGLIVWGLAHLPASFSALTLLVAPVAAALFAWALLGEALGTLQVAGMLVVLAGIQLAWRAAAPRAA